jgi:soluble lytic murein transglycosylase-like protein
MRDMRWIAFLLVATAFGQDTSRQRASLARQRESIQKQAASAGVRLISWDVPIADCETVEDAIVAPFIDAASKESSVESRLIRAVIEQESAYHACAVSPKGAKGLMQLMPATAERFGVHDIFDPKENIQAGAKFLKELIDKYSGDLPKALGAYNAGPKAVDSADGIPDIPETRDYVEAIMNKLEPTRTDPPQTPKPKPIEN